MQFQTLNNIKLNYPFGSVISTRVYASKEYRYGFNGKEIDYTDEGMGGGGSTYDYGFRIYNPNLAKFLSVDPLFKGFAWYTTYQFSGNKPIHCIDLDGLEEYNVVSWYNDNLKQWHTKVSIVKIDGPLTVNYFKREWDGGEVPENSLLAKDGFEDTYEGTSNAHNPWKTEKQHISGEMLLRKNTPPQGKIGDGNTDNNQFSEASDPTLIPIPPVTPPIAPVKKKEPEVEVKAEESDKSKIIEVKVAKITYRTKLKYSPENEKKIIEEVNKIDKPLALRTADEVKFDPKKDIVWDDKTLPTDNPKHVNVKYETEKREISK
jgi:RHS repeat-associated protein